MFRFFLLIVTYVVSGTSSVRTEGDVPLGSVAVFEQSGNGQKGQMTAENYTKLTLLGYDGLVIRSVTLSMHSNTSSGAGTMGMYIGNECVWTIEDGSFAQPQWNGSFSTGWKDIGTGFQKGCKVPIDAPMEVIVYASENSLYVSSYTIEYQMPHPQSYTVSFVTNTDKEVAALIENNPDEGIVLPECQDADSIWKFAGWCELPIWPTSQQPEFMRSGEWFIPESDVTLYAVYEYYTPLQRWLNTTDFTDGKYLVSAGFLTAPNVMQMRIVNGSVRNIVSGTQSVHALTTSPADIEKIGISDWWCRETEISDESAYIFHFLSDSTLQIRHSLTNEFIGHSTSSMSSHESVWNYQILDDNSLAVYFWSNSKTHVLFPWLWPDDAILDYECLLMLKNIKLELFHSGGLFLFRIENTGETEKSWTSFPLRTAFDSVEGVTHTDENVLMDFGSHRLLQKDGKKVIVPVNY